MVLQLDNVDGTENFLQPWARHVEVIRRYAPSIERWRGEVEANMPESLRRRSDAAQLVDKFLWTMAGENSAGDPTIFHDGGNGYGLMADRVSRTPPGTAPGQQIANAWSLVANNPKKWTDWGEGSSYQGKPFGALGALHPYDPDPSVRHPASNPDSGPVSSISPPNVGEGDLASWVPPSGYASSSDFNIIDKLRIAREKRQRESGEIPTYDETVPTGDVAGYGLGGIFKRNDTSEYERGRTDYLARRQKLSEFADTRDPGRDALNLGLGVASDVFNGADEAATNAIPGYGLARQASHELGGPDFPTLGEAYGSDIPGYSNFARDKLKPIARRAGALGGTLLDPLGIAGRISDAAGGPSPQQAGAFAAEGSVPVSAGDVALTLLPEAGKGLEAARAVRGAAGRVAEEGAVRLAANETFDRLAPPSLLRNARAGAAIAQEGAGYAVDPRSPFARTLRSGAGALAGLSEDEASRLARGETVTLTRRQGARTGGGYGPEVAGGSAGRDAYGEMVRRDVIKTQGEDRAARLEQALAKQGMTWADYGEASHVFDNATPAWEQAPGTGSARAFRGDPRNPDDVAAYVRSEVAADRAERAGTGTRAQMEAANARRGGARSGRQAGEEVGGGSALPPEPEHAPDEVAVPKKTTWTITNAAGDSRQVETEIPTSGSVEAAQERFARNTADQERLNRGMSADSAGARGRQGMEGVEQLRREARRPEAVRSDGYYIGPDEAALEPAKKASELTGGWVGPDGRLWNLKPGEEHYGSVGIHPADEVEGNPLGRMREVMDAGWTRVTGAPSKTLAFQGTNQPTLVHAVDSVIDGLSRSEVQATEILVDPVVSGSAASEGWRGTVAEWLDHGQRDVAAMFSAGRRDAAAARIEGARQGRMFGPEVSGGRATGPRFGTEEAANRGTGDRIKSRDATETALREGPFMEPGLHELAQGLEVKPEALGLTPQEDLIRQGEAMRAGPRSKNRMELGRNAAQLEVWKHIEAGDNPAELIDAMSNAYVYRKGTTPRDRGFINEMQRLQEKLLEYPDGELSINWSAVRTESEGAALRGDKPFDEDFLRAADAERRSQQEAINANREAYRAQPTAAQLREREVERLRAANAESVAAGQVDTERALTDPEYRQQRIHEIQAKLGSAGAAEAEEHLPPQMSGWAKVARELGGLVGIPRTLMTSGPWDMSALLRNISVLGSRHPSKYLETVKDTFRAYGSDVAAKAAREGIEASPLYESAKEHGLKFWDWGAGIGSTERAPGYEGLNESVVSKWVEKAPWVKGSERAMATAQNVMGMRTWEEWAPRILDNTSLSAAQKKARLSDLASVINHSRGFSGTKTAEVLGSMKALFSGQFTVSRFQVLGDPVAMLLRGSPEAAQLAGQSLLSFMGSNALMLGTLGAAGAATGAWSVNFDPTSSDFGQLKIGSTRYDTLAGFGPLMKLTGRIGAIGSDAAFGTDFARDTDKIGSLLKTYFENKEQPVARAVTDFLQYNKLPDPKQIPTWFVPMLASGMVETLWNEDGLLNKAQGVANLPFVAAGGGASTYKSTQDVANQGAQERYGRNYDDLTRDERLSVIGNAPDQEKKVLARDDRKAYESDRRKAGYQDYWGDTRKASFFEEHPELEARAWYFDGRSLRNVESVDRVLDLGVKDKPVRFAGIPVDIGRDEKTRKAWDDSKDIIEWYSTEVVDKQKDATARRMYRGKSWEDLNDDQRSSVVSNIRDNALQRDPEANAWMFWWGRVSKTKTLHATTIANGLLAEYGPGAGSQDAGGSVGALLSGPQSRSKSKVRQPEQLATARRR